MSMPVPKAVLNTYNHGHRQWPIDNSHAHDYKRINPTDMTAANLDVIQRFLRAREEQRSVQALCSDPLADLIEVYTS